MSNPYDQRTPRGGGFNRDEVMSDVQRWPDSSSEQYGGGAHASSSSSSGDPRDRLRTRLPAELKDQLTPEEVALFNNVRQKTLICWSVGMIGGFLFGRRLGRRATSVPAKMAWLASGCAAGVTVGTVTSSVLGIKEMQKLSNPQHLRGILQTAVDMENGRPPVQMPPGRHAPGRQRQGQSSAGWGDESMSDATSRSSSTDRYESMRGDFGQGQSTSYRDSNTGPAGQSSQNNIGQAQQAEPQQQKQPSRWQQLRANNSASASTWERIRQDNAREAYNARRSGQQEQDQPQQQQSTNRQSFGEREPETARQQYQGMADPTFGKGTTSTRERAQREYQASFERERRGIDG